MSARRVSAFADTLRHSAARRGLFLLFAALASSLLIGYHTGTFDQVIHLPMLRALAEPGLYPGDPIVALRAEQYSFFWYPFVPALRMGVLEPALLIVHLAAVWATFAAIWELALALFDSALSALLAVCVLIFPHVGFIGFPIIEFSTLSRTVVLPLMLLAMALHFRGRTVAAFAVLGAAYNLHLVSVNFALLMLAAAMLAERRRIAPRTVALSGLAFVAAAAPVLAWKLLADPQLELSVRPEWLALVAAQVRHIWHPLDGPPLFVALAAGGVSGLVLGGRALRAAPSARAAAVRAMLLAGAGLMAVQELIAHLWPATALMQLQLARICMPLLLLAYVSAAHGLAHAMRAGTLTAGRWWFVALPIALLFTPLFGLGAWLWARRGGRVPRPALAAAGVAVMLALTAVGLAAAGIWRPGYHPWGPQSDWEDAQRWARDHTPRDALFVTPPGRFVVYESDWRVYSERSSLATIPDLLELALMPQAFDTWLPGFEAVAPGAAAHIRGDYFADLALVRAAWAGLGPRDFAAISCRFGADYAVLEQPSRLALPVVFENAGYRIYRLESPADCTSSPGR